MYDFLKHFHSGWAYLVVFFAVVFALITLLNLLGVFKNLRAVKKISFFTTLTFHIQLLVGLVLYFVSPLGFENIAKLGMKGVTSNETFRLYALEHPLLMIAGVVFITIANAKTKRTVTQVKAPIFIFALIALFCVLAMIPWQQWMA